MRALVSRLFVAATVFMAPVALAQNANSVTQQKEALRAQAAHEMGSGRLDVGARLTCQASELDPSDKDLAATCKAESQMVGKQLNKFANYFSDGVELASSGHLDEADKVFRRIRFGQYKAEADEWLQIKLPTMRKEADAKTRCKCQCVEVLHFPE